MRPTLAYTSARILLFVAALGVLYLAGARGALLLALAIVVSGVVSLWVFWSFSRSASSTPLTPTTNVPSFSLFFCTASTALTRPAKLSSAFWVKITPTVVMLLGLWIAWNNYIRNPRAAASLAATFPGVYKFVSNKWYFDELYDVIFVRPALWLGRLFWKGGDEGTIDRFGPHGAAYAVGVGNRVTYRFQSGYLYSYALVMLLGLIGAASWAIWWAQ